MLRRLYDWTMAKAAHPYAGAWLALFAFVEASFFPIPPHPLLGLMCLANPKRAVWYAACATAGSVAGGLLGYAIGHFLFASVGAQLLSLLHLSHAFPYAACQLRANAFMLIVGKGVTPIPFKLVTITAGFVGVPLGTFIAASLLSRSISFMIVGVLFRVFGAPIKAFIDRYLIWVTLAFVAAIVAGFLAVSLFTGRHGAKSDACSAATMPAGVTAPA
ncbi:YqaA family protein [Novosphingobium sp.]|uniref:YqaA family protein n=1 Tax=Novosphingobium sp. TaxID=1874826 RepID=UPI003B527C79